MKTGNSLDNFDYRVECDDFLLYELARLIDEDRASFEDEEFRRVIEEGIHEHIERRLDIRTGLAMRLRKSGAKPDRMLRSIEDIESPLSALPEVIQSYTAYVFQRLEECSESGPDERVTAAADALFESCDQTAAEASIESLASIRSTVSARVLAHLVSEPMLDEDLEAKAFAYLRAMWPMPRHYILYSLKPHAHEDIPFRWFQLLIEANEPSAVDRILEEVLVHGGDPEYREDLLALVQLLARSLDPDAEEKVLQTLNSSDVPRAAVELLESFLKNTPLPKQTDPNAGSPWTALDRIYASNRRYLAAAKLFDAGKKAEAAHELEELLREDPQYPFAVMLKGMA